MLLFSFFSWSFFFFFFFFFLFFLFICFSLFLFLFLFSSSSLFSFFFVSFELISKYFSYNIVTKVNLSSLMKFLNLSICDLYILFVYKNIFSKFIFWPFISLINPLITNSSFSLFVLFAFISSCSSFSFLLLLSLFSSILSLYWFSFGLKVKSIS